MAGQGRARVSFTGRSFGVIPAGLRGSPRDEVLLSQCLQCGALVADTEMHADWHDNLRKLGEYVETLDKPSPRSAGHKNPPPNRPSRTKNAPRELTEHLNDMMDSLDESATHDQIYEQLSVALSLARQIRARVTLRRRYWNLNSKILALREERMQRSRAEHPAGRSPQRTIVADGLRGLLGGVADSRDRIAEIRVNPQES